MQLRTVRSCIQSEDLVMKDEQEASSFVMGDISVSYLGFPAENGKIPIAAIRSAMAVLSRRGNRTRTRKETRKLLIMIQGFVLSGGRYSNKQQEQK